MEIFVCLSFDAAHFLPNVPEGHKCGRLHGHTFQVELHVQGDVDTESGWVMDFGDIKRIAKPVLEELDHNYLNDIQGLENPTSENIAVWLWRRLEKDMALSRIIVRESPTSAAIYTGK